MNNFTLDTNKKAFIKAGMTYSWVYLSMSHCNTRFCSKQAFMYLYMSNVEMVEPSKSETGFHIL